MKKNKISKVRFICPKCTKFYEIRVTEINNTTPKCLRCNTVLIKSRRRR